MKFRKVKIFDGKKVIIRSLSKNDLKKTKKFQDYINSLIKEEAKILFNKKMSLKNERDWLKKSLQEIKNHRAVYLAAEHNNIIVASAGINLGQGRENHIGNFGITIREGYRRIKLGSFLWRELVKLAKKELKSSPKIIRLTVYVNNKPAINFYKKHGFKKVAQIPDQIQFKGKLVDEVVMLLYLSKKQKRK